MRIFFRLLVLLTIIPIVELYLLFKIAEKTSFLTALLIVILTGILGAYLAKHQGRIVLYNIKMDLSNGQIPGNELLNGLCVLIGGIVLITPGIMTDIVGFSLLLPGTREIYKRFIIDKFKNMIQTGNFHFYFR